MESDRLRPSITRLIIGSAHEIVAIEVSVHSSKVSLCF